MPNATYGLSLSIGGVTIQPASIVRTGDHPNVFEVTLPPGTAGTLSTRTDDDTGVITAAGHALQVGDKVNVYWSGGRRYGMTVSAVAGNDVTVGTLGGEVGSGDIFPAQSTAVVITKPVQINSQIDGDAIQIIGVMAQSADPQQHDQGQRRYAGQRQRLDRGARPDRQPAGDHRRGRRSDQYLHRQCDREDAGGQRQ